MTMSLLQDVYPRSDNYIQSSNQIRAMGLGIKRLAEEYDNYNNFKKCTCNPAKRFKRQGNGQLLNNCTCGEQV